MFEKEFFGSRTAAIPLMLGSLLLTLTQILATTWCNANSDVFGYYLDDSQRWHSCVYAMPGEWFFFYGAILLNILGALNLFAEAARTRDVWLATKTINLSRVVFSLSFLTINFMLEVLSRAWMRPSTESPFYFFFDNFWYLFPITLALLLVSGWSIQSRVELIFTLNKRRR